MTKPGLFIVIEGVEGAGKTEQTKRLDARFNAEGVKTLKVREPGGTAWGEKLRELLINPGDADPQALLLGFFAARLNILKKVIIPTVQSGINVIADRYYLSTYAYQCFGPYEGEPQHVELCKFLMRHCDKLLRPDLILFFDTENVNAMVERARRSKGGDATEFDNMDFPFHHRVRAGMLDAIRTLSLSCVTLNVDNKSIGEVTDEAHNLICQAMRVAASAEAVQ
jgi:dTMP kinase